VPVRAAQAAETLSRGGEDQAPGGPGGVFRTPGPRFAGLAGGDEADLQAYRRAARRQRRRNVPAAPATGIRWAAGARRLAGRPGQQPVPAV